MTIPRMTKSSNSSVPLNHLNDDKMVEFAIVSFPRLFEKQKYGEGRKKDKPAEQDVEEVYKTRTRGLEALMNDAAIEQQSQREDLSRLKPFT